MLQPRVLGWLRMKPREKRSPNTQINLQHGYVVFPIAIEIFGAFGSDAQSFFSRVRMQLITLSQDLSAQLYLTQALSVAIL